ncbi:hypothetical protein cyc_07047 [Cyclospora cayetanensis]|uniref:Uncharacterized protein n=1 Tax=Cyclospora cayetanensis TaxID=88456 RepID=A0A1D3CZL4_9EIME|nr:hypothetical protein cyc_07047 [Cyclospora cayetanensis]
MRVASSDAWAPSEPSVEAAAKSRGSSKEGEHTKQEDADAGGRRAAPSIRGKQESVETLRSIDPGAAWHEKRRNQQQRRAQYIQSGRRLGSYTRTAGMSSEERKTMEEKQSAAEERLDRMLADANVQIAIQELENCRLSLEASISGEFTRQLWELTLTSLRASLGSSLHASPLDISQAFLLQKAGGAAAVRKDVLRFLAEAIVRKARVQHKARILGGVDFAEDLSSVADRFSPGSPLTLKLCAEAYPKVQFKRSYKGLKLRVPRRPHARGQIFRMTEDYLLYKHSKVVDYPEPLPSAQEGDTVVLRVDAGWFEERDGTTGEEIPTQFISGQTTLDLVKPWLPTELLESVAGIAVGESRTIRVAIPFHTQQLLDIYNQQCEGAEKPPGGTGTAEELQPPAEGQSLVPIYLENIAKATKGNIFKTLFGGQAEQHELDKEKPKMFAPNEVNQDEKNQNEEMGTASATEEDPDSKNSEEDVHYVDCLLQVECLNVKRRIIPKADDEFFVKTCGMNRTELWELVESSGEELVKEAASKHALGAAAEALDQIAQVDIPGVFDAANDDNPVLLSVLLESLIDAQASATWKQQLKAREVQGEDNKKFQSKDSFLKWKQDNRRGVENILRTSFAIQAICRMERLQVDEEKLQKDLAQALLKVSSLVDANIPGNVVQDWGPCVVGRPLDISSDSWFSVGRHVPQVPMESAETLAKQLYKRAQATLAYDFIVKHAEVEYYIDDTPAEVTVQADGVSASQQCVRAFPKGTNIDEWHKKREQTLKDRDALQDKARSLCVDPKTLKKYSRDT